MKNIFKKFFEKKKIVNQKYLEFEKLKNLDQLITKNNIIELKDKKKFKKKTFRKKKFYKKAK